MDWERGERKRCCIADIWRRYRVREERGGGFGDDHILFTRIIGVREEE